MYRSAGVAALTVSVAVTAGCTMPLVHSGHQPDTSEFFRWALPASGIVSQIPAQHAWMEAHKSLVLAEGERACRWIRLQPTDSSTVPTQNNSIEALAWRYVHDTSDRRIARVLRSTAGTSRPRHGLIYAFQTAPESSFSRAAMTEPVAPQSSLDDLA